MSRHILRIQGNCPMGCGPTLVADSYPPDPGSLVWCSNGACPRPQAAAEILAETETEHIVRVTGEGWSCKHPLRERLDDELLHCPLMRYMESLNGPPVEPGEYRARYQDDAWAWEPRHRTRTGRLLTDADIEALADEAEAGYDVKPDG